MTEEVHSLTIQKQIKVDIDALEIPDSSIFNIEHIRKSKFSIVYSLVLNGTKIGFALITVVNEDCHELAYFEIFDGYKGKGYGTFFAKFIIQNHSIHLEPINGSVHWWIKLGAKPLLTYVCGYVFCISHLKPSEYFKLLNPTGTFYETDDFVYDKAKWDDYAAHF